MITPERGVRVVDGLLTGWHEPDASHLLMLEAIAGRELVERSYAAALDGGYRWHEFGDSHLILPLMRAIVLHEFGPAENLRYEEVDDPAPAPGQVRIAVAAAGVHLIDTTIRSGASDAARSRCRSCRRSPAARSPAWSTRSAPAPTRRGSAAASSRTSARRAAATPSWRCARPTPCTRSRTAWPTTPRSR